MNFKHNFIRWMAILIAAAFITAFASVARAQNLLTNPSFELGTFTNRGDGFQILPVGSMVMTGWIVINDTLAWGTIPNSAAGVNPVNPFDGSFFLDLQGDGAFGAPYGGVTQTITTVAGQQYHLAFYLGTQQDAGSPATHGPVSVSATAGGTVMPFTFNPGGTGTQWGEFGFDFTASSTSTPISILGTNTAGGSYIGLDFVSVTVVPELSPASLVVGCAFLVGFIRRKRHIKSAVHQRARAELPIFSSHRRRLDFGSPAVGEQTTPSFRNQIAPKPRLHARA